MKTKQLPDRLLSVLQALKARSQGYLSLNQHSAYVQVGGTYVPKADFRTALKALKTLGYLETTRRYYQGPRQVAGSKHRQRSFSFYRLTPKGYQVLKAWQSS